MKISYLSDALSEHLWWKIDQNEFNRFVSILSTFNNKVREYSNSSSYHEINYVFLLHDFLRDTFYPANEYEIIPLGNTDLTISKDSNLLVLAECKKPDNSSEMVTKEDFNRKAFHELIWYYLESTRNVDNGIATLKPGLTIRNLLITNFKVYFSFKPADLEKIINSDSKAIERMWLRYKNQQAIVNTTQAFYEELKQYIASKISMLEKLPVVFVDWHNLQSTIGNKKLLYKFLYKDFLINEKRTNTLKPHVLNRKFYEELLYLMGMEEYSEESGSKILIRINKNESKLLAGQIYYKMTELESDPNVCYERSFELSILWINRLLFLKLFEGQLLKANGVSDDFKILSNEKIQSFDDINHLFFSVLGKKPESRPSNSFYDKFKLIPYLNSSLFELQTIERNNVRIKDLDNCEIYKYSSSVLRTSDEKLPIVRYLIDFLSSWDFSSSINDSDNIEVDNKIIDAAVLGQIFEKLNGYQDGSIYTPSEITEFLAKQSVRGCILSKACDVFGASFHSLNELRNYVNENGKRKELNDLINSITYCDPAVGSGHFLVSLLNRIIATKNQLGVLYYSGSDDRVTDFRIEILNDELNIKDIDGNHFIYKRNDFETLRLQKTLFEEKTYIIENCLFGADLNKNAVSICRLRLWIELLKNAYYENGTMQTLPNIDRNIKCGDSIIRTKDVVVGSGIAGFAFNNREKELLDKYKELISQYQSESDKDKKREINSEIERIATELKLLTQANTRYQSGNLFDDNTQIAIIEEDNYVDWKLNFPKILDKNGILVGFDCVIGNPPFIPLKRLDSAVTKKYKEQNFSSFNPNGDLYCLFIELGIKLLKRKGRLSFITSNKWLRAGYGENLRNLLSNDNLNIEYLIDLGSGVFENATVDSSIIILSRNHNNYSTVACEANKNVLSNFEEHIQDNGLINKYDTKRGWAILTPLEQSIKQKIEDRGTPINERDDVHIYNGYKSGANPVFIIDQDKYNEIINSCDTEQEKPNTERIIKPVIRGRDIKNQSFTPSGLYMILTYFDSHLWLQERCPSLFNYLSEKQQLLESRGQCRYLQNGSSRDENNPNYPGYPGQHHWLEIDNNPTESFFELSLQSKVAWPDIATDNANFARIDEGYCIDHTAFFIPNCPDELLRFLNSKIVRWYISITAADLGESGVRYQKQYIDNIPIPTDFTIPYYEFYGFSQEEIDYLESL